MGPSCTTSRWILVTTFVLLAVMGRLWLGLPALAQEAEPVRLSALEITLWPEFDRPELLVIFQGRLADDVPLPAVLTLTMPREAGEPHAVASVDEAGQRLTAAHDVQVVGDELKVTYTSLEHRAFQFEYYWDILQVAGDERRFEFAYKLDAVVDDFSLELQRPSGASNVILQPLAAESYPGFADLTYHRLPFGAVDAGQVASWQVSYTKSGAGLSAEALSTGAPAPSPAVRGNSSSGSGFPTGAAVAIGVALVVLVGGSWIVGSRRRAERQRSGPWLKKAKPPVASSPEGGFCHRCGAAQKPDAMFCHNCGARRKGT